MLIGLQVPRFSLLAGSSKLVSQQRGYIPVVPRKTVLRGLVESLVISQV